MADPVPVAARGAGGDRRALFVLTILTGSFLLFLVQPMVARMALPRLGGAPAVWNSAMLVYQALLLGGYAYAHRLGRLPLATQIRWHIGLLIVAALTLPIALVDLPPPRPGWEALWVPALLALSIGPVFFLVSAQAPLMQRWYAADPQARAPWALYAASNLGSFAGLIAYPLAVEPLSGLGRQGWLWSAGYALLVLLVLLAARGRRHVAQVRAADAAPAAAPVPARRIALWLMLSAVPSGLMLSTTTHLTTDIVAMPLLWVIPLGLYLLSFVIAFADRRGLARAFVLAAPAVLLAAGGLSMMSRHASSFVMVMVSVGLLFVVCVTLHARLYDSRPDPDRLTLFYFVMSAGGALGGLFTALIAPLLFDWVWEHPLLVFAAALLLPRVPWLDWRRLPDLDPGMARLARAMAVAAVAVLGWFLLERAGLPEPGAARWGLTAAIVLAGLALAPWRGLFALAMAVVMLAQGGLETARGTLEGVRTRSYFGVYTVRDYPDLKLRMLAHGTTLHGEQSLDPALRNRPIAYYGPGSGVAAALEQAGALYGPAARVGVVGLGTGTLACYRQPGQDWRFFEIDPAVERFSRQGVFTYLKDCAPDARVIIGDARLTLEAMPPNSLDILAIDAFSSDSIPLHLMTEQAFDAYLKVVGQGGLLVVHISNRFMDLEPQLAALARTRGLAMAVREDAPPPERTELTPSTWVLMARKADRIETLTALSPAAPMRPPVAPAPRAWTDDRASVLPYIRWNNLLGRP